MGQTDRELANRFQEHRYRPQPVKQFSASCGKGAREENVVAASTTKGVPYWITLEAHQGTVYQYSM